MACASGDESELCLLNGRASCCAPTLQYAPYTRLHVLQPAHTLYGTLVINKKMLVMLVGLVMGRSSQLEKIRTANEQLKRTLTEDTDLKSSHTHLERSRLVPSVPTGPGRSRLVPSGPERSRLVPSGPEPRSQA